MPESANDRCSARAAAHASRTLGVREGRAGAAIATPASSFSSLVAFGAERVAITSDGIGTKVELGERLGSYRTLGYDLVAMVVDDLASNGVEPTSLSNILDVDRLDERIVDELMVGLGEAAVCARVALTGGEIAELGSRVGGYGDGMHFNWSATAIGTLPAQLATPIDGSRCAPGDVVVALGEPGLRSNGFSLARRILGRAYGERWHERPCAADDSRRSWGELLLTPSRVCCSVVTDLVAAGVVPHGIAHITGGGIPSKLGRVLRRAGLGAELDRLPEPPAFMSELGALGNCPRAQAVHHWNMGTAMLLLVAPTDVAATLEAASAQGHRASVVGSVVDDPSLRLWSGPSTVHVALGGAGARP